MQHFQIDVASHFFVATALTLQAKGLLMRFSSRLEDKPLQRTPPKNQHRWGKGVPMTREPTDSETKRYYCMLGAGSGLRVHISYYHDFMDFIATTGGMSGQHIIVNSLPVSKGVDVPWVINEKLVLRSHQEKALEFILEEDNDLKFHRIAPEIKIRSGYSTRLVGIPPGEGKTITALVTAGTMRKRMVAVMQNKYIPQWCGEIKEWLGAKDGNIVVVNGYDTLVSTAAAVLAGEIHPWAILISVTTLQGLVKKWEEDLSWINNRCSKFHTPDDVMSALEAGIYVYDEAHEHFHSVYRTFLTLNTELLLCLSATPSNESDFVKSVMLRTYPKSRRFTVPISERGTDLIVVEYNIDSTPMRQIKCENAGMYNHAAFENSIMKNPKLLNNYLGFISTTMEHMHTKTREPNDKALVYVARIEFGTIVVDHLRKKFPDLDIRRVMEDDPHEDALVSDIRVGSTQRLGTGVDMKGLTFILDTVSVSSENTNIQKVGRLRPIKNRVLKYAFTVCTKIPKHIKYANRRVEILRPRVRNVQVVKFQKAL